MTLQFENSALWKATLAARDGDEFSDQRTRLRAAYMQMRENVAPVAGEVALSVPNYTDHSITHCDALWDTASLLAGDGFPINPAEAFVLGAAFLIHDLGMGLSAYPGGLATILEKVEWLDLIASMYPEDHTDLQSVVAEQAKQNPTWDGISDRRIKLALTIFLRQHHAEQSEHLLTVPWTNADGSPKYLLPDNSLRHWYGEIAGKVARSHWVDVAALPDGLPGILGAVPGLPQEWTVEPCKIACLLRLADAIQIDARRADPLHTPHRDPQGDSANHWKFQERILGGQLSERRVVFTSSQSFTSELADAWWLAYETVCMIDSELRRVDNLCADLGLPRLAAHAASGAESPERFAAFVETSGWEPVDARPFIGDPNLVMRELGGEALYGSVRLNGIIPLRELLANAIDATRARRKAFGEPTIRPIEVQLNLGDEFDSLTVRDFGIGMTSKDIAEKLCNFGMSGWRDHAMQAAFPGLMRAGFSPTGRFGIGFFSVFMVAKRVRVVTRHIEAAKAETYVLSFENGLLSRPMLRPATRAEQLMEPGTVVHLQLDERAHSMEGIFSDFRASRVELSERLTKIVRSIALTSDESISVIELAGTAPAVVAEMWKTLPPTELFDAINPMLSDQARDMLSERDMFEKLVTDVSDDDGNLIGRLGMRLFSLESRRSPWISTMSCYAGGLKASGYWMGTMGVLEGEPDAAGRKDISVNLPLPVVVNWFGTQVSLVRPLGLAPKALMEMNEYGASIGHVVDDFPLAFSTVGYATRAEVVEWISGRDEFLIVSAPGYEITVEGQVYCCFAGDSSQEGIALLSEDTLLVPDGISILDRTLALRPNDLPTLQSESSDNDDGDLLRDWWGRISPTPSAEVMRCAAEAWDLPLREIADRADWLYSDQDGEDRRAEFKSLGGEPIRSTAFCVTRSGDRETPPVG